MGKCRRDSAESTSDTIKVLFCTNVFEKTSNGPAKFAHLLLENAKSANMEVYILTEDISETSDKVYKLHINIPKLFKPLGQFIRMFKYHSAAMEIHKKKPYDFLVYNNALVGIWSSIKFSYTIGMINDDNNASSYLKNVFTGKETLNKKHLFHFLEYIVFRSFSKIIVNSNYLKQYLLKAYKHKRDNIYILYKGIDLNSTIASKQRIIRSILFLKSDYLRGGLFDLIDAIKKMDVKPNLTIIGPPKSLHTEISNSLNQHCESLFILEYATQMEVFAFMEKHEIFCVPSHKEALGVANLEAMAAGCKIVSTKVGGIPEAVGNTGVSWLVSPNNPKELKKAIEEAFNTDIASNRVEVIEHLQNFSAQKVVKKFRAILQN